jgi:hypothetical protein
MGAMYHNFKFLKEKKIKICKTTINIQALLPALPGGLFPQRNMLHRNTASGWRLYAAMQHGRVQWCSKLATTCRVTFALSVIWVMPKVVTEVT